MGVHVFPILTPLPPPSPNHPPGSSQCTSLEHPVSCIKPGLVIHFTYDIIHVSMPFSEIISPSPSPTESIRLFYTSVSLLLSCIQGYHYYISKFHIYALVYCIGIDLGEWHWNMYKICETNRQSRFDAWYRALGAGALGWPRGMGWGGT